MFVATPAPSPSNIDRLFDLLMAGPRWLDQIDDLGFPRWVLFAAILAAAMGLVFAAREFVSWFLKTGPIVDEVLRLETMVADLQGDMRTLENAVRKLEVTANPKAELPPPPPLPLAPPKPDQAAKSKFPLTH